MRAVVFDAFGTLIESRRQRNPYARMLKANAAADRDIFLTVNRSMAQFAGDYGCEHLLPTMERELQEELGSLRLFPDVAPALAQLRASGRRVAVCSNLAHAYGDAVRDLLPGMAAYTFSFEAGARKPQPEIYENVCQQLRCRPQDVLFIGDSVRCDVDGPKRFGMASAHLDRKAGVTIPAILRAGT